MARDRRIDSLKGLLIILVIMGHVITTLDNVNIINHAVMGFIYVFHMPLFIIISGYLTKPPGSQPARDMWLGVGNIAIALVIFHALNALRIYAYGGSFTEVLFNRFPFGGLWYLMALIYWRIALYYTPSFLLKRPVLYLGIALIITLLSGFTHLGNPLALQRGLNFYFFFLLGYYYRLGAVSAHWWKANALHAATAIVLLPVIFLLYPRCGNIMNGADHYGLQELPQKILIVICSVSMSLLVFNLMKEVKYLVPIGKDSLFYYLYHFLVISLVLSPLHRSYGLPHTFPFIVLYTAAIAIVVFLMSKVGIFRWLVHPTFKRRHLHSGTTA